MLDQDDRQADRLGKWLKERFHVGGLVATQDAPVWQNDTLDDTLTAQLARLDTDLTARELSFSPALRYALSPAPEALRILRQHEGAAPGALAVLCPENEAHLTKLAGAARAHGFRVATKTSDQTDLAILPVDVSQLNRVTILSGREGRVRFQTGTTWDDLSEAAAACRLAMPNVLRDLYQKPADAVRSGFLPCDRQESAAGIVTAYETTLPPEGTRWLERLWLFTDPIAAIQSFEAFCRHRDPVFAQLITAPLLDLAALSGLYGLPLRLNKSSSVCGLRIVFQGPSFDVSCASFAASWPLESAWGKQWNKPLPSFTKVTEALYAAGVTVISLQTDTSWDTLPRTNQSLSGALTEAAADWPSTMKINPITGEVITYIQGSLLLHSTVLAPRDYLTPFDQWHTIHKAGQCSLDRSIGPSASAPQGSVSEESPEWQAIRNALLDENGGLRPLQPAPALSGDERRHG
ncbi:MAG: FAD-dependent oxidoreductase [Aquisalinus sp.]|nr:FAD-dependent oxidoreductase [Aquisalinus sp.]